MAKSREQYIWENSESNYDQDLVSFSLIDEDTIKRREREGDVSTPFMRTKKYLNIPKDERWNTKQLNSKLLQGILNGDPIPKIAQSFLDVVNNNESAAMRNARTMITQAECGGRQDSYENLADQGVVQKKVWIATPDDRTRESHIDIDGEEVDIDDTFSNGCAYPADPSGDASEVYNCRCSMRTHIIGIRRPDGTIVEIGAERDDTMHDRQMQEEKERRGIESEKAEKNETPAINITNRAEAVAVAKTMFASIEDNVKRIDEELLCKNIAQLKKLNDKFGALTENNIGYLTSSASGRAIAYTGTAYNRRSERTNLGLVAKYYKDAEVLKNTEIDMRDKKWSMPFSDEYAQVFSITHEYGHILEAQISKGRTQWGGVLGADFVDNPRKEEKDQAREIRKEIVAIAKENNPDFNLFDNISQYGKTNDFEFFAEVFANSQCGAPNELGDAMNEWLKKEGY